MTKKILTKEIYEKLKAELERLKKIERKKVAEKIKIAKEFGDLSENTEYHSALAEQEKLEKQILKLENLLRNVKVIRTINKNKEYVDIDSQVEIMDLDNKKISKIQIVSFPEIDPFQGKISQESPLGKALFKKKLGDIVEVEINGKIKRYKIKKIY